MEILVAVAVGMGIPVEVGWEQPIDTVRTKTMGIAIAITNLEALRTMLLPVDSHNIDILLLLGCTHVSSQMQSSQGRTNHILPFYGSEPQLVFAMLRPLVVPDEADLQLAGTSIEGGLVILYYLRFLTNSSECRSTYVVSECCPFVVQGARR